MLLELISSKKLFIHHKQLSRNMVILDLYGRFPLAHFSKIIVASLNCLPPVQHHHKRSLLPSSSSPSSPSASSVFLGLQQQQSNSQHQNQQQPKQYPQCLQTEYHSSVLSFHSGPGWDSRVCSASSLDERVRLLLEGSPCRKHRVCQVSNRHEVEC